MRNIPLIITMCFMVFSLPTYADDKCDQPALFFEQQLPDVDELTFKEERIDIWIPKSSYFDLINYH